MAGSTSGDVRSVEKVCRDWSGTYPGRAIGVRHHRFNDTVRPRRWRLLGHLFQNLSCLARHNSARSLGPTTLRTQATS